MSTHSIVLLFCRLITTEANGTIQSIQFGVRRSSSRLIVFVVQLHEVAERAHRLYDEAFAALPDDERRAQRPGLMMAEIYRTLLREIETEGFQVLHQRVALTPLRKLWLAWKTNWKER